MTTWVSSVTITNYIHIHRGAPRAQGGAVLLESLFLYKLVNNRSNTDLGNTQSAPRGGERATACQTVTAVGGGVREPGCPIQPHVSFSPDGEAVVKKPAGLRGVLGSHTNSHTTLRRQTQVGLYTILSPGITNIVSCTAYIREVGRGVVYCLIIVRQYCTWVGNAGGRVE